MTIQEITSLELRSLNADAYSLIDVRTKEERKISCIPNSVWIPMNEISLERISEIFTSDQLSSKVILYCRLGIRSMKACIQLDTEDPHLDLYNLVGGIQSWIE